MKNLFKNTLAAIVALFIAFVALPQAAQAQTKEAYVVKNGATLTFYYDTNKATRKGTVHGINDKRSDSPKIPAWAGKGTMIITDITKVVFDNSFKDYKPTSTAYWFFKYAKINAIEGLSNLKTDKVTSIGYMFYGCSSLTSLDLSNFNTENVVNMASMFCGCSSLTALDLSNFNTAKVTDMGYMFKGCSALKTLNVSSFNTANVTEMRSMFNGCKALTALDLSNFNTAKVHFMQSMFAGCSALTTIYCNDDWNSDVELTSDDMFTGSTSLVGAVAYDASKTDVTMANPTTGYFTKKDGSISQVEVSGEATIVEIYTIDGIRHSELQQGLNVVRMSDGTTRKIMHRQ